MTAPQLVGIEYDASSSHLRGPALAPAAVRAELHGGSANYFTELGANLDPSMHRFVDRGDLGADDVNGLAPPAAVELIERWAADLPQAPTVTIGGDHSITWPLLRAFNRHSAPPTVVHIDAHPDTYDHFEGDRYSHACPFARIMEEGLAARLLQFGIRTANDHQREQAERFGIETFHASDWNGLLPPIEGPVYVSIDADGFDPAFAPGVSHIEPGGLTTRQVLSLLHQLAKQPNAQLVGADMVEINPTRDVNGMTAMLGAKLVRELLGLML